MHSRWGQVAENIAMDGKALSGKFVSVGAIDPRTVWGIAGFHGWNALRG